jgi:hypothetical protein
MTTFTTMTDLQNYLSTTTYDMTIILIAYPFTPKTRTIENLLAAQYSLFKKASLGFTYDNVTKQLKPNKAYTYTYEYLTITAPEIYNFYLANVTTQVPYLVTYKKEYKTRTPWWYPCKQVDANSSLDDINRFIYQSLKN